MTSSKKIVLLGHFGVGKTSIIRKYTTNEFSHDYKVTIGVHILKKVIEYKNKMYSLLLWDLEGTDDLEKINRAYLLGTHAFIYVYDVTRPLTFKSLKKDIIHLKTNFKSSEIKIIGNKTDLVDENYKRDTLSEMEDQTDFFTSAKTGQNISVIFNDIVKDLSK